MKKLSMVVLVVIGWIVPETASAQLPRPPRRSKDDKHHASQPQHDSIKPMAHAWAECLAPHVASMAKKDIRLRLSEPLQNQYSDHAVWNFRQALVQLIRDDLHMSKSVFENGGRALIDGGEGVADPLVEQLARDAVATSGGALRFETWLGGIGSLEHFHDRVLRDDPSFLARLEQACCSELAKDQQKALLDMRRKYLVELKADLPITLNSKNKTAFERHLKDTFETTDTERAVEGLRSKLREAMRYGQTRNRKLGSAEEYLAVEVALNALVDEHLDDAFWERFRSFHAQALTEPKAFRKAFRDAKDLVPGT